MHTDKQRIFDKYAKIKEYENWKDLDDMNTNFDEFMIHVFAACDLVQQEQQKRISENAITETVIMDYGPASAVDKDSILNPENLIQ
ncbi:hypothetical protein [Chryseobacterium vrystaatense]|uniref:Uncharacterized protein n=1 Tax=Chryseobacterium vrystaatense TaxID=307480 RepID=A0A1M4ZHG9_9FLAO|nr:hypothetical protein [Chryseobacterium vrystaatense]SHF17484.1 hypothetical protein SAMN02787073_1599 [Chryseobacterium vrystaatense]